jgi:hypothetical protein
MTVYDEIKAERDYQVERWGTKADTELNTPNDFVSYIAHYATRWLDGTFEPYRAETADAYRTSMVKVATLAVAAVEALDAQRADSGHAFFEKESA